MSDPGQFEFPASLSVRSVLTVDRPPHWRARERSARIFWTAVGAACLPLLAGFAYFGWMGLWVVLLSVGSVMATDWIFVSLAKRPSMAAHGGRAHTVLMGLLLGLTLPPMVDSYVIVLAGVVTVVVGKGLLGGLGHCMLHPALVGRCVVQMLFPRELAPAGRWLLLDREHLFLGNLNNAVDAPIHSSWLEASAPGQAHAFSQPHPLSSMVGMVHGPADWVHQAVQRVGESGSQVGSPAGATLFDLLWARLPALGDMMVGAVPGFVGTTCTIALLIAALFLMFHGYLRWQLVVAFLLGALVTAAVCPLQIGGTADSPAWQWLPGLQFYDHLPVGPIYVAYHLVCGELLLACVFFAGDMVSRPITLRGQVLFGVGCGVLTVLIRLYLFLPGAAFVAVLLMNTLNPLIDRISQPRAFGH